MASGTGVTFDGKIYVNEEPVGVDVVSVNWELVQGPSGVGFTPSSDVLNPVVTFSVPGTYTFRLTAWDDSGSLTNFDEVQVKLDQSQPPFLPGALLVDGLTNPVGHRNFTPVFSWVFSDPDVGDALSAFRVEVFGPGDSLAWDTEKVFAHYGDIRYGGVPLLAGTRYEWRVTVWDSFALSSTSETRFMTMTDVSPELLVNPGFELGDTRGWSESVPGLMFVGASVPNGRLGPRSGNYQAFWILSDPSTYSSQRVDLTDYGSRIDSGQAWIHVTGWLVANDYNASPAWDQFLMQVRFYDGNGSERTSSRYDTGVQNVPTWEQYGVRDYLIPAGVRSVEVRCNAWEVFGGGSADDFSVRVYTQPATSIVELSAPAQTPEEISGGGFRLELSTNLEGTYLVEASSNLVSWEAVITVDHPGGKLQVVDPDAGSLPTRFYRARHTGP